jgi:diguanylate cyclase (GGDEF)-like protein
MSLPDWYQWDEKEKKLSFFGGEAVILWKDPSLTFMQVPVIKQLGESFYFLLLAYEASEDSADNFNYIMTRNNCTFEEGFAMLSDITGSAGWGSMSLKSIDWELKQATIEIEDPWELSIRETKNIADNLPIICGKASGIFSRAMKCNMRATVTGIQEHEGRKRATIQVSKSNKTLKSALEALNKREGHTPYERVQILNKELQEAKIELEQANLMLTELATKDDLTGAYNRRYFMSQTSLHHSFQARYKTAVSVMMLDIDHFKEINDNYGHQAGDISLIEFSNVCKENLRDTDMFSRLGGEEFAISMPGLSLVHAVSVAEKIRQLIEHLVINHNNQAITFTVSIGVVEMQQRESLDSALSRADKALYSAKHSGRNQVTTG